MADSKMVLEVEAKVDGANSGLKSVNSNISDFEKHAASAGATADRSFSSFESTLGRVKQALLGIGLVEVGKQIVGIAADFERARIGMEALTGSAAAGNKLFKEVQDFALKSPFQFKDLLVGSNRLMAMGFAADKVLPTLRAISAAGAALNYDSGKMADLTNAFGQIQASGRITGETMRELRHAAIPAVEILGEKFKLTGAQVEDAIEKRMIPGALAVRALVEGLNERFGKFDDAVSKTASVAISNLKDEWQKLADAMGKAFLPQLVEAIHSLRGAMEGLGEAIKNRPQDLRDIAIAVGEIGALLVAYKIGGALVGVSTGLEAIGASLAANPLGLLAMGIVGVAIAMHQFSEEYTKTTLQGKKSPLDLLLSQGVRDTVFYGKAAGGLGNTLPTPGMGFAADVMAGKYSPNADNPYKLDPGKAKTDKIRSLEAETAKQAAEAWGKEHSELAKILADHDAHIKQLRVEGELNGVIRKNIDSRAMAEWSLMNKTWNKKQAELGTEQAAKGAETLQGELDIYASAGPLGPKSSAAADYEHETWMQGQSNNAGEIQVARDTRMRALDLAQAQSLKSNYDQGIKAKVALEQAKLDIEIDYLKKSQALQEQAIIARYGKEENEAQTPEMKAAVDVRRNQEIAQSRTVVDDAVKAAREDSSIKQASDVQSEYQKRFDAIKNSAGSLFDALVTRTKSFGDVLVATLRTAILTPIKEAVSTWIAGMLMGSRALTGGGASSGPGTSAGGFRSLMPIFTGGTSGSSAPGDASGGGGQFGGYLPYGTGAGGGFGILGVGGFGDGSDAGLAASPGGGFANGPDGLGVGMGSDGVFHGGASAASGGGGIMGSLGQIGMIGNLKKSFTGLGNLGSSFSTAHGGFNGAAGGMMLAGGGLLAMDGLKRGGGIGMIEDTAGGALIGAKFGGPVGAMIGGAIGLGAGALRWVLGGKSPEQKMKDAVKDAYGVSIDTAEAKSLVQRAGGIDFRVFIQQASIRDEILLYTQMTKQSIGSNLGMDTAARGVNLTESGGSLYQSATYSAGGAFGYQSSLASLGSFQTLTPNVTVVANMDGRATTNFLGGAAVNATSQSQGRTGLASNLLSPAMGTI